MLFPTGINNIEVTRIISGHHSPDPTRKLPRRKETQWLNLKGNSKKLESTILIRRLYLNPCEVYIKGRFARKSDPIAREDCFDDNVCEGEKEAVDNIATMLGFHIKISSTIKRVTI